MRDSNCTTWSSVGVRGSLTTEGIRCNGNRYYEPSTVSALIEDFCLFRTRPKKRMERAAFPVEVLLCVRVLDDGSEVVDVSEILVANPYSRTWITLPKVGTN